MKTIPEKIILPTTHYDVSSRELANSFNSLIDVVTEQQKEIEGLKTTQNYILSKQSQTIETIKIMKPEYSAQRSTGEYCVCEKPYYPLCDGCTELNNCHICHKPIRELCKPIKPQEDVREKLERVISEFYFIHCKPEKRPDFKKLDEAEGWNTRNLFKIKSLTDRTVYKILTIVRGNI